MFTGTVFGIIPPILLLVGGGITLWRSIVAFRQGPPMRTVAVLLLIAAVGTLALILLAVAPWVGWSDADYGALYIPLFALLGAAVWNAIFLTAATVVGRRVRSRAADSLDDQR